MKDPRFQLTIFQLLEKAAAARPEKEALYDRYRRLTYRELFTEANRVAGGLHELGIRKGDRVAVCLPNWHEFIVIYFALARLGAIMVPFNTRYRLDEVEYILGNSGAKFAFFTREFGGSNHFEQFVSAQKRVGSLERLVTVRFTHEGLLSYDELLQRGQRVEVPPVEIDPKEDVFSILYTSGTTGRPKGAMLTHSAMNFAGVISAIEMRCSSDDVFLVAVPVFHVFGMVPSIITAIASEAKMVLVDVYKAEDVLRMIEQEKITVHHGVPTMFILELNHPSFSQYDMSSLRTGIVAAAPCPVEIIRRIRTEMGCNICHAWGMTETCATVTLTRFEDSDEKRSQTAGKAVAGAEVKIVDDQRREVPYGTVGELACRTPGLMKGYYQMPSETREVLDEDGWLYTGDLATMDEDGYIRIVGRKKEMIIRGGYNIYPKEIEEVLYQHPAVMEAAIVGLPDSVLGEIACACIRLKPGATATEEELRSYVKERVADYKVPDKIKFVEEFPMTASGKIQKLALQERLKNELQGELR